MISKSIKYIKGYKYTLTEDVYAETRIRPLSPVVHELFALDMHGQLFIHHAYSWDGCSSVAIDTNTNMRAGLLHDVKFQMMRLGYIDRVTAFPIANQEFREDNLKDGMNRFRAWYYYECVSKFSWKYTFPAAEPKILEAP